VAPLPYSLSQSRRLVRGNAGCGAEFSESEKSARRQAGRNHLPGIRTRLRSLGLKPETVAIDAGLSVHEVAAILDAWKQDVRRGRAPPSLGA